MKGSEMVKLMKKSDVIKSGRVGIMKYGTAQSLNRNSHSPDITDKNWELE